MSLSKHEKQLYLQQLLKLTNQLNKKKLLDQHIQKRISMVFSENDIKSNQSKCFAKKTFDIAQKIATQQNIQQTIENHQFMANKNNGILLQLKINNKNIQKSQDNRKTNRKTNSTEKLQPNKLKIERLNKPIRYKIQNNSHLAKQNLQLMMSTKKIQKVRSKQNMIQKSSESIKLGQKLRSQSNKCLSKQILKPTPTKSMFSTMKKPLIQFFTSQQRLIEKKNKSKTKSKHKYRKKTQNNVFQNIELPYTKQVSFLLDYKQQISEQSLPNQIIAQQMNSHILLQSSTQYRMPQVNQYLLMEQKTPFQQQLKNYFQNQRQATEHQQINKDLCFLLQNVETKIVIELNNRLFLEQHNQKLKQKLSGQIKAITKVNKNIQTLQNQLDKNKNYAQQTKKDFDNLKSLQIQRKDIRKYTIKHIKNNQQINKIQKSIIQEKELIEMLSAVILELKASLKQQQVKYHVIAKNTQFAKKLFQNKKAKQFNSYEKSQSFKIKVFQILQSWL